MSGWAAEDVDRIGAAQEIDVTTARSHGSLRPWTTIWVVRVGDDLYIRSFKGSAGKWYQHASATGTGRIRAGGVETDVGYERTDGQERDAVDAEYRRKYERHGPAIVEPMTEEAAVATTLRLVPRP